MFACLVLFSLVFFLYLFKRKWKKEKKGPPVMPGALPIIGHAYLFLREIGDTKKVWLLMQKILSESIKTRGITAVKIFSWSWYCIADPDDFYNVATNCLEKDVIYTYIKPWLGEGLFTAEFSTWKKHRKMISPAFNPKIFDVYLDIFNKRSKRLLETLSMEVGKGPVCLSDYLKQFSLDIILLTTMGLNSKDININHNIKFLHAITKFIKLCEKRGLTLWMNIDFLYNLTKDKIQMDQTTEILHNYADEIVKKRKAALKLKEVSSKNNSSEKGYKSFLDLLLDLSMQGTITDNELRDELNTMIFGGYDTSFQTLMNVLVMIGSYPHVQKRICDELNDVFENDSRDVNNDDLARLVYLEAVIKETLRLYPVGPIIARYVDKDIQLKNCCLPAGSSCFLFICGVHRHPIWGPDAEEFKPERWLDPTMLPDHPGAYGGFSIGRRSCIGKIFAMKSMKVTSSHILRRYEVSADCTKITWCLEVLLTTESGNDIALEYRTSKC